VGAWTAEGCFVWERHCSLELGHNPAKSESHQWRWHSLAWGWIYRQGA
jgi:hypothetical protein